MLQEIDRRLFVRYGGKRAWLRLLGERVALAAGRYSDLEAIDWRRVDRVVFVCAGNICRSPYGEARARATGIPATSFGLSADPTSAANARARAVAGRRGVDLTPHRARTAAGVSLTAGDCVLLFDPLHVAPLRGQLPAAPGCQIGLLGLWSDPACPYIHDPYGLDERYFEACFARIDSAVRRLAELVGAGGGR